MPNCGNATFLCHHRQRRKEDLFAARRNCRPLDGHPHAHHRIAQRRPHPRPMDDRQRPETQILSFPVVEISILIPFTPKKKDIPCPSQTPIIPITPINPITPKKKTKKAASHSAVRLVVKKGRPPTLPHCRAVPSAQAGLTALFGMGRGGTPPQ